MKIVYNACFGGFSLSEEALSLYNKKRSDLNLSTFDNRYGYDIPRNDLLLVEVVEKLGKEANGKYAELKIIEIPNQYADWYTFYEYDGLESIMCEPCKLVEYRLNKLVVKDLTDEECRIILREMVNILSDK